MFEHVTIRASDPDRTRDFYGTVLATLGIGAAEPDRWEEFRMAPVTSDFPATRGLHMGFVYPDGNRVELVASRTP